MLEIFERTGPRLVVIVLRSPFTILVALEHKQRTYCWVHTYDCPILLCLCQDPLRSVMGIARGHMSLGVLCSALHLLHAVGQDFF